MAWPIASPRRPSPRPRSPAPERTDAGRTERALRAVYTAILPRLLRNHVEGDFGLGIASPSYNRITRTHEFYVLMAAEMGDWWWRLADDSGDKDANLRRMEREHVDEAAVELVDLVRAMPDPVRRVVEMRSSGMSWKRMVVALPGRAFFSIRDDWEEALNRLWFEHEALVRRIS